MPIYYTILLPVHRSLLFRYERARPLTGAYTAHILPITHLFDSLHWPIYMSELFFCHQYALR